MRKRYAALKRTLEEEFGQLDSIESKVAELENIRRREEVTLKALQKENDELKKEQFKQSQVLFALRQKERDLISEIAGEAGQTF